MELTKDVKNPLLKRREIAFKMSAQQNPGFAGAVKAVSDETGAGEDKVAVKSVRGSYGKSDFVIEANIYESAEDKTRVEPKVKEKKVAGGAK